MLADLRAYYGVDIHDLWRSDARLTPRTVLWLVEHLPDGSAVGASMQGGPEFRAWTLDRRMLAAAVNLLTGANRQRAGKPLKKLPIQPPKPKVTGQAQPRGRVVRVADLKARQQLRTGR